MPTREITNRLRIEGEAEYKKALDSAISSVKLLGLQVKENAAVYKLNDQSVEGNRERLALLSREMEQQQKIIDLYTQKIEENRAAGQGNSEETQKLEQALIKARTAMAAMNNEYQQTEQKLPSVKDQVKELAVQFGEGLGKAAAEAAKLAAEALAAITAACVAAGKAIYDLSVAAGQYADSVLTMSEVTGVAAQDLQKWEYASQFIDTSVETITASMKKLTVNMNSGSKETAAAFEQLGVSVTDSTGHMRDSEDVFWDVIDALGKVSNETERDQLAMQLLGKSAQELNPLINAGSAAFKDLGDKAQEMGLILSDEALSAFGAFDDSVNQMQSVITAAGRSIAAEFLPATQSVIDGVSEIVTAFVGMVQGVEGSEQQFNAAIENTLGNVMNVIDQLLPTLLDAGIKIILAIIDGILQALPQLMDAAMQLIQALLDAILQALPQVLEVGFTLIEKLLEGIAEAIPKVMDVIPQLIELIVQFITDHLSDIVAVAADIVLSLIEGIVNTIPTLIEAVPQLIVAIVETLTENLPQIIERGVEILNSLIKGILDSIPQLVAALPQIITAIVEFITTALPQIIESGIQLLMSLIQGILDTIPQLIAALPQVIMAFVDFMTTSLPQIIESGIGILMSLIEGIIKTIPQLISALPQVISAFVEFMSSNLPTILTSGMDILLELIKGILSAIPQLLAALPQVVSAILQGLGEAITKVPEIGINIIKGVWEGIKSMASWIGQKVTGFFGGVINDVLSFLGINSPSKKVRDEIGKPMGEGVAVGLELEKSNVDRAFKDMLPDPDIDFEINGITDRITAAVTAPASMPSYAGNVYNYDMSDSALRKMADRMVDAMQAAGIGEAVIKLNDRELGRTMRRGLAGGFV